MGIKEDNKAAIDTTFPPLPATRRTSQMANDLLTLVSGNLADGLGTKANTSHTHVINDITNASTIGKSIMGANNAAAIRASIFTPAAAITNSATNAPTDCPTNAPTDAPTNYGLLAAILGADINATNAKQNATATNVNAIGAKVNTIGGILNTLATRFNLSLDIYRNNGMLS